MSIVINCHFFKKTDHKLRCRKILTRKLKVENLGKSYNGRNGSVPSMMQTAIQMRRVIIERKILS